VLLQAPMAKQINPKKVNRVRLLKLLLALEFILCIQYGLFNEGVVGF
jgi:hypothetical protein